RIRVIGADEAVRVALRTPYRECDGRGCVEAAGRDLLAFQGTANQDGAMHDGPAGIVDPCLYKIESAGGDRLPDALENLGQQGVVARRGCKQQAGTLGQGFLALVT